MNDRQTRWQNRLSRLESGSAVEPLIVNKVMISQWLQEHRAEYNSATEAIKACLANFGLHRRYRKMVWAVYSRTDFSHLKGE